MKLRLKGNGDLYQYTAYLTTFNTPLKYDRGFKDFVSSFFSYHANLIHLAALGLLIQSNEGGARLPRDSESLLFNVFNQLLSPQLMGLTGTKDI